MYFVFLCFYRNEINITNNNNKKITVNFFFFSVIGCERERGFLNCIQNRKKMLQTKLTILVKKKITTQSLAQPCFLKVYVSFLSQEHFPDYCKLYNCQSNMLIQ